MTTPIEGGCLCGGVRYRLHAQPARVSDCHCLDCRRGSAAAFVTWGEMARENIELLTGELRQIRHADRLRSFAACCGTPLFFQDEEDSPVIEVTIASLDQPEAFTPEAATWIEDRLPWVTLAPERRRYERGR